jgi:hypothetical protein
MMVLIYLGMGMLILFSHVFNIPQTYRIIIGVLVFIYGVFRGYRLYRYRT